ncbi:MAG: NAD-dependent epimerase/dehydratase family protein [Pirellulales bacterium]|nr:NAD-dependent epimerase/dehydratase family protein [Pirellulales bacterium]
MNALVTGAGGFLGLYIVEQLVARGDRVRVICRRHSPALEKLGVEIMHADIRDRERTIAACHDVEVVYHAAAKPGIWGPWQEYFSTNVEGTRHVLEGCYAHEVPRLVYTSSPSVTFDGSDQCGVDESAPYPRRWLCHYAHTKAIAEQEVLAANGRSGVATCSLRPHLIWGPRDNHLVPRLVARARAGRLVRVGGGRNLIDTIYVENAAEAHLQAADALQPGSPVAGRAYFLSQDEPVSCWPWIDDILALAGLPPVKRSISAGAAWVVGAMMEVAYGTFRIRSEPRLTRFLAAQLSTSHYFDLTRAKTDFGYRPRVSIAEGMRRMTDDLQRWASG